MSVLFPKVTICEELRLIEERVRTLFQTDTFKHAVFVFNGTLPSQFADMEGFKRYMPMLTQDGCDPILRDVAAVAKHVLHGESFANDEQKQEWIRELKFGLYNLSLGCRKVERTIQFLKRHNEDATSHETFYHEKILALYAASVKLLETYPHVR